MRWTACRILVGLSLVGRPVGFFGRLGQYWDLILDITEVLIPVEALIFLTEMPEERREMTLFRFASERGLMVKLGLKFCMAAQLIYPNLWSHDQSKQCTKHHHTTPVKGKVLSATKGF